MRKELERNVDELQDMGEGGWKHQEIKVKQIGKKKDTHCLAWENPFLRCASMFTALKAKCPRSSICNFEWEILRVGSSIIYKSCVGQSFKLLYPPNLKQYVVGPGHGYNRDCIPMSSWLYSPASSSRVSWSTPNGDRDSESTLHQLR